MRLIHDGGGLTIYQGQAIDYADPRPIDLVLTNPYGPLPAALCRAPALLHQWLHRKAELERWAARNDLRLVGLWNGGREAFWAAGILPAAIVDLNEFVPEAPGWYPEELVRRLLRSYGRPRMTIWDGFMGRGTVAKVALEMGMRYVGVERLEQHLAIALDYLGLPSA